MHNVKRPMINLCLDRHFLTVPFPPRLSYIHKIPPFSNPPHVVGSPFSMSFFFDSAQMPNRNHADNTSPHQFCVAIPIQAPILQLRPIRVLWRIKSPFLGKKDYFYWLDWYSWKTKVLWDCKHENMVEGMILPSVESDGYCCPWQIFLDGYL